MEFHVVKLMMTLCEMAWAQPYEVLGKPPKSCKDIHGPIDAKEPVWPHSLEGFKTLPWPQKLNFVWHVMNSFKAHY